VEAFANDEKTTLRKEKTLKSKMIVRVLAILILCKLNISAQADVNAVNETGPLFFRHSPRHYS
jgi:hypothetical protein